MCPSIRGPPPAIEDPLFRPRDRIPAIGLSRVLRSVAHDDRDMQVVYVHPMQIASPVPDLHSLGSTEGRMHGVAYNNNIDSLA